MDETNGAASPGPSTSKGDWSDPWIAAGDRSDEDADGNFGGDAPDQSIADGGLSDVDQDAENETDPPDHRSSWPDCGHEKDHRHRSSAWHKPQKGVSARKGGGLRKGGGRSSRIELDRADYSMYDEDENYDANSPNHLSSWLAYGEEEQHRHQISAWHSSPKGGGSARKSGKAGARAAAPALALRTTGPISRWIDAARRESEVSNGYARDPNKSFRFLALSLPLPPSPALWLRSHSYSDAPLSLANTEDTNSRRCNCSSRGYGPVSKKSKNHRAYEILS